MADQEWSEGPTLKFLADEPYPCGSNFQLFLATVGDSLVAVFKQGHEGHYCVIYMSTLVDNEWSEPIAIDHNPGEEIFSMVALDENHFALQHITMVSQTEFIEVINKETASVVARVPTDWMCYDGFLYNGQFSCIRQGYDNGPLQNKEIWSLSFQEDFNDPTWSLAYDHYDLPSASYWYNKMAVLNGLLVYARLEDALVNYQTGDQDLWRAAALDIPREHAVIAVVPYHI